MKLEGKIAIGAGIAGGLAEEGAIAKYWPWVPDGRGPA